MTNEQEQAMAWVRKNAWSRERCEELRAISHMFGGTDGQLIDEAADFMLKVRQAVRGGRLEVRGSRHWDSP